MGIIQPIVSRVRNYRSHSRLPMTKLSGTEKITGDPLSLLYAGTASQLPFVRSLIFSETPSETNLGNHFSWSVNRVGERNDCNLVTAVQSITARNLLPSSGYCLPLWVESMADTTASPYNTLDHSMKKDLRRTAKNNLTFVEATSRDHFEFFWERMYLPYAHVQFAEAVELESERNFFEQVDEGSLLLFFAARDGQLLAGGAISTRGDTPRYRYLGVLDGNPDYRKLGAPAAAYIYMLEWAHRNGHSRVNMGGSRPFLKDGVIQYKKKYNISLVKKNFARVLYINPLSTAASVTASLVHNPIIRLDGHALIVTIFEHPDFDVPVPDSLWQYRKKMIGGLDRVERVALP